MREVLAFGFTREAREIPSPLIGRPAPPFTARLTDGREVTLEDFRGKAVFLNFWASWCPPCRAEARDLEASWRRHQRDGALTRDPISAPALWGKGPLLYETLKRPAEALHAGVYSALGLGQVHCFYRSGATVVWLAADPPVARQALGDTLRLVR
ncbi:MAG: TlpA family protein disulfide reductase [Candidatus Rokubacteria bacterium]|nr:TlpA family protein disulfide reductase [Candidatus Rokubacteria bacterium]